MGWDIDNIILRKIKAEILKDRYAGCEYSMATSLSPVIIRHRGELGEEERTLIVSLFPETIRVEFQFTTNTEIITRLHGQGDYNNQGIIVVSPQSFSMERLKQLLLGLGDTDKMNTLVIKDGTQIMADKEKID